MFVRVVQASVVSKPLLRNAWEHLLDAFAMHDAWLGATGGIDKDGRFHAWVTFTDSDEADEVFNDPEVARWHDQFLHHLAEANVTPTSDARVLIPGGGSAGFVQFVAGDALDKEKLEAVMLAFQQEVVEYRLDVLGSMIAWLGPDSFSSIVFFSSEAEARRGESLEFPGGISALLGEVMQVLKNLEYIDIRDPWIAFPKGGTQ